MRLYEEAYFASKSGNTRKDPSHIKESDPSFKSSAVDTFMSVLMFLYPSLGTRPSCVLFLTWQWKLNINASVAVHLSLPHHRAFDVELLYIAQCFKIPIAEVAVNWTEIEGRFFMEYVDMCPSSVPLISASINISVGCVYRTVIGWFLLNFSATLC